MACLCKVSSLSEGLVVVVGRAERLSVDICYICHNGVENYRSDESDLHSLLRQNWSGSVKLY